MSEKVKVVWKGQTQVLPKDAHTFEVLKQLKEKGEDIHVDSNYVDEPDADEQGGPSDHDQDEPATAPAPQPPPAQPPAPPAQPEPSTWDNLKQSASRIARGAGETALDAYRRLTHAATLGFDDELVGAVGGNAQAVRDANAAAQRRSPNASAVADLAGNVGIGMATAGLAPEALAARAALTPAAQAIMESTAIGAAQGAGNAHPGERGRAALTGGAVGMGSGALGTAVGAGLNSGSQMLRDWSVGARTAVGAPNKTMMKGLRERYGGSDADDVIGRLLEKHFKLGPARSADDYLSELAGKLSQGQKAISAVDDQVAAAGGSAQVAPAWERMAIDQAGKADQQLAQNVGSNASREATALDRAVKKIMQRNEPQSGIGPTQLAIKPERAPNSFSELRGKVSQYGDDAFSPTQGRKESAEAKAALDMWQRGKDSMSEVLDNTAPQLRHQYENTNQDFSELKTLETALDNVARGEQSGHLGTEMASGVLGGLAQGTAAGALTGDPLAGAGVGVVSAVGTGTNAVLKRFTNSSKMRDRMANVAGSLGHKAGTLGAVAGSNPALTSAALRTTAQRIGRGQEPVTSAEKVQQALREHPEDLGGFAQQLKPYEEDPDELAREVERLERDDKLGQKFRTLPVFGGNSQ